MTQPTRQTGEEAGAKGVAHPGGVGFAQLTGDRDLDRRLLAGGDERTVLALGDDPRLDALGDLLAAPTGLLLCQRRLVLVGEQVRCPVAQLTDRLHVPAPPPVV